MSIIICTCNRAADLRETLKSIATISVPEEMPAELLVVDNGSTDDTAEVVREATVAQMPVRYLFEERRGQCYARNSGMAAAEGDVFLWTDDDMRLPQDWIASMCGPIIMGQTDAVSGKIKIAPHLERGWMTRTHYDRLADTRFMPEDFGSMIGANMAFSRKVLEQVPSFDTDLGPGRVGFADDTLFSFQMREAGLRIFAVPSVVVEHHVDESRLTRKAWLRHGEATGKSRAYLCYHWEQEPVKFPHLRLLFWQLALVGYRMLRKPGSEDGEGCDRREIRIVENGWFLKQYLMERKKKRSYEKRGLRKIQ